MSTKTTCCQLDELCVKLVSLNMFFCLIVMAKERKEKENREIKKEKSDPIALEALQSPAVLCSHTVCHILSFTLPGPARFGHFHGARCLHHWGGA
ncbi:putative CDP-diacylglycerol--inositol 3-phosphatidyltransferase 2 [Zea mays]|jgi:hypothetical protein|uniref:Putative CDP-diacylglycerol--inositol 3-phosphatidyltransferase 2 n=1 Tax=Zea mays TaxID=4577 RepID=A0A1D6LQ09_MAIZE|nr:putative CDP-diacylglycerol--inositol 3-phosphatidyltransferase 2 [Zea mays]AQK81563.1 putative CDP-diacylglycerol--inositol 3-phosphatidyltransferase 2 [Zea mays]